MNQYTVLVFFHVASVIVWIGVGAAVALLALYAQRSRDALVAERVGGFVGWLSPRVLAPASLSALGFGIAAAHSGHWPRLLWFHVGEGAFAISFLITIAFRLPLLRRASRGDIQPARLARLILALALSELTVLFIAVADMVEKPTSLGAGTLSAGAAILATALLGSVALAASGPRRVVGPPAAANRQSVG